MKKASKIVLYHAEKSSEAQLSIVRTITSIGHSLPYGREDVRKQMNDMMYISSNTIQALMTSDDECSSNRASISIMNERTIDMIERYRSLA